MNTQWKLNQTRTTPLAYKKITKLITKHKNEIKNVVNNASRKGYSFPNKRFSQELNEHLTSLINSYLPKFDYYNKRLNYIIHGMYLYIFSPNKFRLLDVLEFPGKFSNELRELKRIKMGYQKKSG